MALSWSWFASDFLWEGKLAIGKNVGKDEEFMPKNGNIEEKQAFDSVRDGIE